MSKLVEEFEREQMNREITAFNPGDTVVVRVKVKEGNRERLQAFEGVVIAKRNRGLNSAFTVRKISHGEGVSGSFNPIAPPSPISRSSAGATCVAPSCITCGVWKARQPASRKSSHKADATAVTEGDLCWIAFLFGGRLCSPFSTRPSGK